jgi:hypothetical protein
MREDWDIYEYLHFKKKQISLIPYQEIALKTFIKTCPQQQKQQKLLEAKLESE